MLLHGSALLSQPLRERMEDGKTQETGARAAQGRPDSLFTFKTHPLKYIPYPEFLHDNHSISSFMPHCK